MSSPATKSPYAGYRFPPEVISHAVWLYFRFPLSLRMVEEMLAARGIIVSHESVRQWALKFGQDFANQIRRRLPAAGDKWHLDEVVLKIAGKKHWVWRAVDQDGIVLDVLLILLCHKLSFCALGGTALACTCWQHGQRGRRRAKATVRRRRIEMIDNGLWRSGRIGMPSRPLVRR